MKSLKSMKSKLALIVIVFVALTFIGCGGMHTTYVDDTTKSEATNLYFSHKDLQIFAEAMIDDLLATGIFIDRPLVRISQVSNKTTEHIDTKAITDSVRTRLIRSGKVRFLTDVSEKEAREALVTEMKFGESALADSSDAPEAGKMKAAKYHIFGDITSTESSAGKIKERYTRLTLNVVEVETGILEWASEKAILKKAEKKMVGY